MSVFEMKLPDVGEGVAEAELVEWLVAVGDTVTPNSVIAQVLTDKATVEVSAPVSGEVVALHGEPGDVLAVGGNLIGIDTGGPTPDPAANQPSELADPPKPPEAHPPESLELADPPPELADPPEAHPPEPPGARAIAAPAIRARAIDLGIDLTTISGSGPGGRVVHADLDRRLISSSSSGAASAPRTRPATQSNESSTIAVRGVRRRIAERLSTAWREIPHITYVDDVDMTELERLRIEMNGDGDEHAVRLTILPFLARATVIALADQPGLNAHYDHAAETLTTFQAVHVGIATQTDDGLRVPVVRHAEGRGVRGLAAEIDRVTSAARNGSATRDELSGSTITITSLGALGGLATTPIINPPEVAIIGVNKMETRPVWRAGMFQPRQVMNLSSSFDHRMVDGWDAATFIQRIKRVLETPALLFVTDELFLTDD